MQIKLTPNTSHTKLLSISYTLIAVFVGVVILWGGIAPLASAIISSGTLKVDTNKKEIKHRDGGTVSRILVKDGQIVEAGDVLLELNPVEAQSALGIVQSALNAATIKQRRLQAERDGLQEVDFSMFGDEYAEMIRIQENLFDARLLVLGGQREILQQQIENLRSQIVGLDSQQGATSRQLDISVQELANLNNLKAKGLVGNERLLELERNLAQLEGKQGELMSAIAAKLTEIDEKSLELLTLERRFQESVIDELQDVDNNIMDLQERYVAAKHRLSQMIVTAPVKGTVVGLTAHTEGGVVSPGQLLMEIVPANDDLIIEGKLNPTDIDEVLVGQSTRIKLSGFKQATTPEIMGTVNYISADSMVDERTGQYYFVIRVSIKANELDKLPEEEELVPGMPAEMFILTGERTVIEYMLQPLKDTIDRAWRES